MKDKKNISYYASEYQVHENEYVYLWKEGEILCAKYKDEATIGLEAAKQIVLFRRKHFPGQHLSIIYMYRLGCITSEAKKYFASADPNKDLLRGAFIVTNPVFCFFLNSFVKVNKPLVPIKIFTNKQDAIKWLHSPLSK